MLLIRIFYMWGLSSFHVSSQTHTHTLKGLAGFVGRGRDSRWITWDSRLSRRWRCRGSVSQSVREAVSFQQLLTRPSFGGKERLRCRLLHFRVVFRLTRHREAFRCRYSDRKNPQPLPPYSLSAAVFSVTSLDIPHTHCRRARRRMWPLKLLFFKILRLRLSLLFILAAKLQAFGFKLETERK